MAIRIKRKAENEQAMAAFKAIAEKPSVDWVKQLHYHARGAAEALEKIHGGRWDADINHENCFLLISREIEI